MIRFAPSMIQCEKDVKHRGGGFMAAFAVIIYIDGGSDALTRESAGLEIDSEFPEAGASGLGC